MARAASMAASVASRSCGGGVLRGPHRGRRARLPPEVRPHQGRRRARRPRWWW
ncbi:hypothetical protein ACP4OV_019027 [Aristida adscensionis]